MHFLRSEREDKCMHTNKTNVRLCAKIMSTFCFTFVSTCVVGKYPNIPKCSLIPNPNPNPNPNTNPNPNPNPYPHPNPNHNPNPNPNPKTVGCVGYSGVMPRLSNLNFDIFGIWLPLVRYKLNNNAQQRMIINTLILYNSARLLFKEVLHLWALFLKNLCIFSKIKAHLGKVSYGSGQKCSKELKNHSFTSVEAIFVKLQRKMCENQYFPFFEP